MSDDTSISFLKSLASHLAHNGEFVSLVAKHVAQALTGAGGGHVASPAPRGGAKAAPARGGRPAASSSGGAKASGNVDRVLDAIKGGAGTKQDIMSRAKVTNAGYAYALKTLREKRLIKIVGTRRAAKITAA